jgi:hypothetical protein
MPPLTGLIAGGLVVCGVLLWMFVSRSLLFVAGLGAFGPGLLRELGWLRDHDEFQRQAAHRAGYHAYLIGGFAAILVLSGLEWIVELDQSAEWIRFVLLLLWMSWMFSALLSYWGAQRTASLVLVTFGSFWAVFVVASLIGESGSDSDFSEAILGILVGVTLVAAFFVPAWTAHRWPRITGVVLLLVSVGFGVVFGRKGALQWSTVALTNTLLLVPLMVSGIALVRVKTAHDDEAEDLSSTEQGANND